MWWWWWWVTYPVTQRREEALFVYQLHTNTLTDAGNSPDSAACPSLSSFSFFSSSLGRDSSVKPKRSAGVMRASQLKQTWAKKSPRLATVGSASSTSSIRSRILLRYDRHWLPFKFSLFACSSL
ncbi:hypothetical protein JOB18_041764 [Solea senegalensis]|uniref:Secreted protein n=1 Tax=Solea senegalensis TaxID=28829 RepID=A0AAV6RF89_SOLSE|nr:hypothetical protein JOB18_041764 [Solea senegalensis]